jgi:hypothetical protein
VKTLSRCGRRFAFFVHLFAVFAGLSLGPVSAQTQPNIISWGENVSSWNEQLGVTAMREGCSIVPTSCEPCLDNLANLSKVKTYYVSFTLNPSTSVSWAKEYSTLSLRHRMIVEIDFDDFVGRIEDDQIARTMPNPATFVSDGIAATKSESPNLAFGVTIYEDGQLPPGIPSPGSKLYTDYLSPTDGAGHSLWRNNYLCERGSWQSDSDSDRDWAGESSEKRETVVRRQGPSHPYSPTAEDPPPGWTIRQGCDPE